GRAGPPSSRWSRCALPWELLPVVVGRVGGDDDLDPLELLEVGVAGRGHRPTQGADEVDGAVGRVAGAVEDLLEGADRAHAHALAARQLRVVGLRAPVPAAPGRLLGTGEGGAEHDGVGPARDGLDEVAGAAHPAVGDDVDVAAARLVEVVAARGGDVG